MLVRTEPLNNTYRDPDRDPNHAMWRAIATAAVVPPCTTPLIQLETNITVMARKHIVAPDTAFSLAIKKTWQNPMKGLSFNTKTSIARSLILFNVTPRAMGYFNQVECLQKNVDPVTLKMMSYGIAGTMEGLLLSVRTPLLQFIHTHHGPGKNYNSPIFFDWKWIRARIDGMAGAPVSKPETYGALITSISKDSQLKKAWRVAAGFGVWRDTIFWPLYAFNVAMMEASLSVDKQRESFHKMLEEFSIGAVSAVGASIFSFPIHGVMRRAIEKTKTKPELKMLPFIFSDLSKAYQAHGFLEIIQRHIYKGFMTASLTTAVGMGMLKLASHFADVGYDDFHSANPNSFFNRAVNCIGVAPMKSNSDEVLQKLPTP